MNLTEKAAYIKGLMEGFELEADKKETRILNEMLELLTNMATDIEDMGEEVSDLYEVVDEIDEDLGYVEEELYGGDDYDDDDVYECECPNCHEMMPLTADVLLSGEIVCPHCNEKLELDDEDLLGGCSCGHDHSHE